MEKGNDGYIYITVYVHPSQVVALRRLREVTGKSKSALVREALDLLIRRYGPLSEEQSDPKNHQEVHYEGH